MIIDRIEDGIAHIEHGDEWITIPVRELPKGAKEGDILRQTPEGLCIDAQATRARRQHMREWLERLSGAADADDGGTAEEEASPEASALPRTQADSAEFASEIADTADTLDTTVIKDRIITEAIHEKALNEKTIHEAIAGTIDETIVSPGDEAASSDILTAPESPCAFPPHAAPQLPVSRLPVSQTDAEVPRKKHLAPRKKRKPARRDPNRRKR